MSLEWKKMLLKKLSTVIRRGEASDELVGLYVNLVLDVLGEEEQRRLDALEQDATVRVRA